MFSRGSSTKQSSSKSSKGVKPSSSFSKDSGISKRRHEPRRRAATVTTTASTTNSSPAVGLRWVLVKSTSLHYPIAVFLTRVWFVVVLVLS